jgi:hypothetical protein
LAKDQLFWEQDISLNEGKNLNGAAGHAKQAETKKLCIEDRVVELLPWEAASKYRQQ